MSGFTPGAVDWWDAVDADGNAVREFRLAVTDSREVTGALWLPARPQAGAPLVCFGHGASGDRYQLPICTLARRFSREAAYPVLSLDGPIHGLRGDDLEGPEKQGQFIQRFVQDDNCIADMTADWNAAIAVTQSLPGIGVGSLAYFGLSMGSMLGMAMLAQRDDVDVAVLGLVGAGRDKFPRGGELLDAAAQIDCPLLFLMSTGDEIFSQQRYLNVFNALGSKDKRLHANPGGHANIAVDEVDYVFDFVAGHLADPVERQFLTIAGSVPTAGSQAEQ